MLLTFLVLRRCSTFNHPYRRYATDKLAQWDRCYLPQVGYSVLSNQQLMDLSGEPGRRYALPNASVMMHQPSGGAAGQASDIAIHAREILKTRERLNKIYQKHTGLRELTVIGEWPHELY